MAIDPSSIQDPTSTVPPNSEPAPADTSGLPEEVLALPIFAGILQGSPAALWTEKGNKSTEATTAVKFQKPLADAGIFLYRDEPSKTDVIFNGQFFSPELIKEAAKKGELRKIASPLDETLAAFNGAAGGATPQASGGMPSSVPVDSPLDTQRKNNLVVGPATSGLAGQGRVLNSIVQPVV